MLTLYGKRLTKHIELFDEIVIMNLKLLTNRHCLQEWLNAISLQKIMIHCLLEIFTNRLTNRHKHTIPCRTPHFLELSQHASLASKLGSCSAVLVLVVRKIRTFRYDIRLYRIQCTGTRLVHFCGLPFKTFSFIHWNHLRTMSSTPNSNMA